MAISENSNSLLTRPNLLRRFWDSITKTPARRFLTVLVLSLILSAVLLALMFIMPQLMIGLTMALGAAAIWMLPATFAAQITVFVASIVAASAVATTFFWGIGELLGLVASKCRGDEPGYEPLFAEDRPTGSESIVNLDEEDAATAAVRPGAEAERPPVLEKNDDASKRASIDTPPTEKPPAPPSSGSSSSFFDAPPSGDAADPQSASDANSVPTHS